VSTSKEELRAAIKAAGLTQRAAAALVHISQGSLEAQLSGRYVVNQTAYELLLYKTGQKTN